MADALGAIEDMINALQEMPGVHVTVPEHEPHILRLLVTLDAYDEPTWDEIVTRADDLARDFFDEFSVDLRMAIAA